MLASRAPQACATGTQRQVYVHHTHPPPASPRRFYDDAVAAGWETHELRCGHDMMLVAPEETADLLESIATQG